MNLLIVELFGLAAGLEAIRRMILIDGSPDWNHFTVLLLLACVGARMRLMLPGLDEPLSLWFPFGFAAVLEQPPWAAFVILSTASLFDRIGRPEASLWRSTVFHLSATATATLAAAASQQLLPDRTGLFWAAAAALAAVVYFVTWSVMSALRQSIVAGVRFVTVWNRHYFWVSPIYFLAPCGAVVANLVMDGRRLFETLLGLSLVGGVYWYLRTYFPRIHDQQDHAEKLAEIRQRALETLAVAIEAKDGSTAGHLQRVQMLATLLARRLECTQEEIRTVQLAAVLHDVGKVGVPDFILKKPSRLTDLEFQEIVAHARLGAEIVSAMDFPEPVDQIVLSHHEHWDGSGYPRGLRGEQIPRLARMLTVIDCFDALVSDRPYRSALPIDQAIQLMRRQSGKIFDPEILNAFLELLPEVLAELQAQLAADTPAPHRPAPARSVRQTWIEESAEPVSDGRQALLELSRNSKFLELYHQTLSALHADLAFHRNLSAALRLLRMGLDADHAGLYLETGDAYALYAASGDGSSEIGRLRLPADEGLLSRTRSLQLPCSVPEDWFPANARAAAVLKPEAAALASPVSADGRSLGALVFTRNSGQPFDSDSALLLLLLGDLFGRTILAERDLDRMQSEAQRDRVTALPNQQASRRRLEQELARARRQRTSVGILFMDLNGLKPINDSYGHEAGDAILRAAAEKLKQGLREYDFVGRYGGDEFVAIVTGISPEDMIYTADKLKAQLAESPVDLGGGNKARTLISVGAAHFPRDGGDAETLLRISDRRMYEDKETWRAGGAAKRIERPAPGPRRAAHSA